MSNDIDTSDYTIHESGHVVEKKDDKKEKTMSIPDKIYVEKEAESNTVFYASKKRVNEDDIEYARIADHNLFKDMKFIDTKPRPEKGFVRLKDTKHSILSIDSINNISKYEYDAVTQINSEKYKYDTYTDRNNDYEEICKVLGI